MVSATRRPPWPPTAAFWGLYGKAHPVVFFGEPRGVNAGKFPVWDTPLGRLVAIICFDLNFTGLTRRVAAAGAQLVAAPCFYRWR
jgi:apolipoprotein N-acyltransferase